MHCPFSIRPDHSLDGSVCHWCKLTCFLNKENWLDFKWDKYCHLPLSLRAGLQRLHTQQDLLFCWKPRYEIAKKTSNLKNVMDHKMLLIIISHYVAEIPWSMLFRHCARKNPHKHDSGKCYKTFYSHNLIIFIISYSVCPWQAFQALFYVS